MSHNGKLLTQIMNNLDKKPRKVRTPDNQWQRPGQVTFIGSPNITMEGVGFDAIGVDVNGYAQYMKNGKNYQFTGPVTEYPLMEKGGPALPDATYVRKQIPLSKEELKKNKLSNYRSKEQPTIQTPSSLPHKYRKEMYEQKQREQVVNNILQGADVVTDIMQLGNFVPFPGAQLIGKAGNMLGSGVDAFQMGMDTRKGNYGNAAVNAASMMLPYQLAKKGYRRDMWNTEPGSMAERIAKTGSRDGSYIHLTAPTRLSNNPVIQKGVNFNRVLFGSLGAETMYDSYENGGQHGGLDRWFAEKWVDVKTGKACGRQEGEKRKGYPACRPSRRVSEDTPKTSGELSPAEREKFKRSKTSSERINYQHRRKEDGGETNEQDMANKPNNPSLWSKAKSLAKQKFDVYPSAYANGWAAKWYKSKGGTWRKAEYGMEVPPMQIGGPAPADATYVRKPFIPNKIPKEPEMIAEWAGDPETAGLVDYLDLAGFDFSKANRSKLAQYMGVKNYDFSAKKNNELLKLIKKYPDVMNRMPHTLVGGNDDEYMMDGHVVVINKYGGEKMPPEIARARFAAAGNLDKLDNYGYAYGGYIPEVMAYGGDIPEQDAIDRLQKREDRLVAKGYKAVDEGRERKADRILGRAARVEDRKIRLMENMAYGGEPNGEMALGQMAAVSDKMSKLLKFVKSDQNLDPWIASKLAVMDHSADAISDYLMYGPQDQQEQMDEMGKGGYVVTRSNDRKGKTHKVTGPDGTVKYFGDSKLGQHPKDPERKAAFYARHKKNLEANPYFRAFARATWADGGSIVNFLVDRGMASDKKSRSVLAEKYGVDNYDYSAEKNLELLGILRKEFGSSRSTEVKDPVSSGKPLAPVKPSAKYGPLPGSPNGVGFNPYQSPAVDKRNLESGTIVDKGTNTMYIINKGKVVKSAPVLTGQAGRNKAKDPNMNPYSLAYLENNPGARSTPTGTYFMNPNPNIYGWPGFNLQPINAFNTKAPDARAEAIHITYGANPKPGLQGHPDPAEFKRRNAAYMNDPADRYRSYGCTNAQGQTIDCLQAQFPKGDTAIYIDSRNPVDMKYINSVRRKKNGGYVGYDGQHHVSDTPNWNGFAGYAMGGYVPEFMTGGIPCYECGGMYKSGGPVIGQEMDVTPQQLEMLRAQGYEFEII